LALEIQRQVEELQAVRREQRLLEEGHRDKVAALARQIETLERQWEPVQKALADERRQIEQLRESIAGEQKTAAESRAWIKQVVDAATPVVQRIAKRANRSPLADAPKRAEDYAAALARLKASDSSEQARGLEEFAKLIGEEWNPARSIDVTNERVEWNGGKNSQHAWVLRLGAVTKMFVTEDGRTVGVWTGDPKLTWRTELPSDIEAQVKQVVAIAREQRPPAVVPVPLARPTGPESQK
jgi:hypothetical protein